MDIMEKKTKRIVYIIVCAVCAISVVLEILFAHPHGDEVWHTVPGADVIIAFVGGWALMLFATKILAPLLERREDYWEKGGGDKKDE